MEIKRKLGGKVGDGFGNVVFLFTQVVEQKKELWHIIPRMAIVRMFIMKMGSHC